MQRRDLIIAAGGALTSIAGCAEVDVQTQTKTPTAGSGGADSETVTASGGTPTPTGVPDKPGSVDSATTGAVTVGDVTYRFQGMWRAEKVGGATRTVSADGIFVTIALQVTNNRPESVPFPGTHFRIRNADTWQYPADDATAAAANDDRVALDAWSGGSIASSSTRTGIIAFDVDPSKKWAIWILPAGGGGEDKTVSVGDPTQLDFLQGVVSG